MPRASPAARPLARASHTRIAGSPPDPQSPSIDGDAIDPLVVPTPPAIAGAIYGRIRRLALQSSLPGADRVLRDAFMELTASSTCAIAYPGQHGPWTLGVDDELPRDARPLVAVASKRRAVIRSRVAMIPVVTTTETVAVITLTRGTQQPGYLPIERIAMVALAREAAPILHHLTAQHLQCERAHPTDEGDRDLDPAREPSSARELHHAHLELSPRWARRGVQVLVTILGIALAFGTCVQVSTYSSGTGVVMFEDSTSVTATASGTVEQVLVRENESVREGDPLIRLAASAEEARLAAAESALRDSEVQSLFDQADGQVRRSLARAANHRDHARALLEARTIRAPRAGVVTNLHVQAGSAVQPGSYLLQVTDEESVMEVLAFLPGKDIPRIRAGMELELELVGHATSRVLGMISDVQPDVVSGSEAARMGGDMLAESIASELSAGTWTIVHARLPSRRLWTRDDTNHYHHGMHARAEVKIDSRPFLVTLWPALENYLTN